MADVRTHALHGREIVAAALRPAEVARRLARIAVLGYRRALVDDVPAMASALAYKTLLGLVPILIVVTLVAKTLMGAKFAPFVAGFIGSLGLDEMRIVPPTDAGRPTASPVALGSWVESLVTQAAQVDLSALGWLGVAVTVASAVWLMTSVELSFNRIYRARQGRPWTKRVILYWFVLTASPLLIAAIPILAALLHRATETPGVGWAFALLGTASNVVLLWALLGTVYLVVPAGPVRPQCAAIGAFVAAVTIIALKGALAAYFQHAFGMSRLYGSLGLVPVFMFWMWVVWMAVLGGLEVSAIAQTVRVRGLDAGTAADDDAPADPMLAVAAMECAAAIWRSGRPVTRDTVAADLRIDDRLAAELLEVLVRGGFLFHTESDAYAPARPPATIRSDEVLRAALSRCAGEEAIERSTIAAALRATQLERAREIPVANASLGGEPR